MLFVYCASLFCLYCGIHNWVKFGYSNGSLVFVVIGVFPFMLKLIISFHVNRKTATVWNKKKNDAESSLVFRHETEPNSSVYSINEKALMNELENVRKQLRELQLEYDSLRKSFDAIISTPVVDEEAEMELVWLREENARLQGALSASENAVAVLNQQLDVFRKQQPDN